MGATFTVEFPLTSFEIASNKLQSNEFLFQAALTELSSTGDYKLKNRRILIVEDDSDTQALLRTMLERHGADVVTVNSSAAGLTEVQRRKPDVIISDIGMTGENGYEFIKRIRSLPQDEGGHIPAIALTAYAAPSDRRKALLAGFQTHLAKPIEPAELLAVISSLTFQQEDFS
jgi:CheY-like chemotaxis protein